MAFSLLHRSAAEGLRFTANVKVRDLRTMAQFAEEEIRIPDDPTHPGYRINEQPSIRHWFEA
ncbi:hypothetical protein JXA32_12950, partial [Candidatus Sumerlaeota bacterium]|nr:hypothetical protein [Candidatus Sumerlaeota bacterium]